VNGEQTSAQAAQQEYISRVDAYQSTHRGLVRPWHPPEAASPAVRPFALRREARRRNESGSRPATTWRPLFHRRGWPMPVHGEQGRFHALFESGLTCVVLCSVVGCFLCKRRAELFSALQFCTSGQ